MKTPVNRGTIREHLTYSWWKYALLIVLGALLVNLYYTVTSYHPPAEKKINLYIYGYGDEQKLNTYLEHVWQSDFPEMEDVSCLFLGLDETYGPMQLTTYVAAGEGDVFMLPRDEFVSLASSGAWVPLEEDEELMSLFESAGASLQSGWRRESGEGVSRLFGIPLSALPGLSEYVYVENGFLCVLVTGGNVDTVQRFLHVFCRDMLQTE